MTSRKVRGNDVPNRLISRFGGYLNFVAPQQEDMVSVFSTILNEKFQRENFESTIKGMTDKVSRSSLEMLRRVQQSLRPIPSRCHYQFTLRDVSRVISGLLCANKTFVDSRDSLLKLWAHEIMREFHDRLVTETERKRFIHHLDEVLMDQFDNSFHHLFHDLDKPEKALFTSFHAKDSKDGKDGMGGYQEVVDYKALTQMVVASMNTDSNESMFHDVFGKDFCENVVKCIFSEM